MDTHVVKHPRSMTQKEAFLFYLSQMDMEMLDLVLPDHLTYFGVRKGIFLERLSSRLKQFQLAGEKLPFRIHQKDPMSHVYYLRCSVIEFEQEFVIEDLEGEIVSIDSSLVVDSEEELEALHCLELYFGIDERADFRPTVDYSITLHHCTNAFEELVNQHTLLLDDDKIKLWNKKHSTLYKNVKNQVFMFQWNDFRHLYQLMTYLSDVIACSTAAKIAVMEFDASDSAAIQRWKDDFRSLFFCEIQSFDTGLFDFDQVSYIGEIETLQLKSHPNIHLFKSDFADIKEFHDLYVSHCRFEPISTDLDDISF